MKEPRPEQRCIGIHYFIHIRQMSLRNTQIYVPLLSTDAQHFLFKLLPAIRS